MPNELKDCLSYLEDCLQVLRKIEIGRGHGHEMPQIFYGTSFKERGLRRKNHRNNGIL